MAGSIGRSRGAAAYRRAADAAGKIPACTALPAITGTAKVGETLTGTNGTWTRTPDSYAKQWLRNGVVITGAVASTYVLAAADLGAVISLNVLAVNEGVSARATSAGTAAVAAA